MAKSIKFKNNVFLDWSGVTVDNNKTLANAFQTSNINLVNTWDNNAIDDAETKFGSAETGFSTSSVTSGGGPSYFAFIWKYNASYGVIILVTYMYDAYAAPIMLHNIGGTWIARKILTGKY